MQQHTLELSQTLIPGFCAGKINQQSGGEMTAFELSMMCGSMVHRMSTFSISSDGSALSMEWVQKYPI